LSNEHSRRADGYSDMIREFTLAAIGRYHETARLRDLAQRFNLEPPGHDPSGDPWSVLANGISLDAERHLIEVLLALGGEVTEHDLARDTAIRRRWKASGVVHEGRVYLTIPEPDIDEDESDVWIMKLVEFDDDAIMRPHWAAR
jgi:hypothetical protein